MSTNLQESTFFLASDTGLNNLNPPSVLVPSTALNSKGLPFRDRNAITFYFTFSRTVNTDKLQMVLQGSQDNISWYDDTAFTPVQLVGGVIPLMDLVTTSFKRSYSAGTPGTDLFSWSLGGSGTALRQMNHNFIRLANIVADGATSADRLTVTANARKFLT